MKRIIIALIVLVSAFEISAQKNVKLRINHQMNGSSFALNTETSTSMGDKIKFTRVQYYLSDISITHDGGNKIELKDTYLLVDASKNMDFLLGNLNVTTVEEIGFSVGVDQGKNHSNPVTYPKGHALSPKLPSMHWGWTSGYRFVAIEGKSGDQLNNTWEFHCLGDNYYYNIHFPATNTVDNGDIIINVNADYTKSLSSIDVSSGLIVHGLEEEDLTVLKNFRDSVFSNTNGVLETTEVETSTMLAFPNPSTDGTVYFSTDANSQFESIQVTNILGELVSNIQVDLDNRSISGLESGVYFVRYSSGTNSYYQEKIVVSRK
jgi:hypothetical protein